MEIETLLKQTEFPVCYHHFNRSMKPPFVVWLNTQIQTYGSDDHPALLRRKTIEIQLYTKGRDESAEKKIEACLLEYAFTKDETYLQTEDLYLILYEMQLLEKIKE